MNQKSNEYSRPSETSVINPSEPLIQLIYTSTKSKETGFKEILEISRTAKINNINQKVTGLLVYFNNSFLQVLEGGLKVVNDLFQKISKDTRHKDVLLLEVKKINKKEFENWSMKNVSISQYGDIRKLMVDGNLISDTEDFPKDIDLIQVMINHLKKEIGPLREQ